LVLTPFVTVTSSIVKPKTSSLNVAVTGIGDTFVGSDAVVLSVTAGPGRVVTFLCSSDGPSPTALIALTL
jgi:hypothetical protein